MGSSSRVFSVSASARISLSQSMCLNPIFGMLSCMFFLCSKFNKEAIWLDVILFKKYTHKCLGMNDGDLGVAAISTGWQRSSPNEIPCVFPDFSLCYRNFPCVIFMQKLK